VPGCCLQCGCQFPAPIPDHATILLPAFNGTSRQYHSPKVNDSTIILERSVQQLLLIYSKPLTLWTLHYNCVSSLYLSSLSSHHRIHCPCRRHQFLHTITPLPWPLAPSKQVSSAGKTGQSSSAWSFSDQTTHLFPLPPPEPSLLVATIINILERTSGGGGHAGNRRQPGTPELVTVVTLLLFAITIATVLRSEGQDVADDRAVCGNNTRP